MTITLEQLITNPHLRSKTVHVEGLGDITIHELPASDVWDASRAVVDDPDIDNRFYARLVLKSIGAGKEPSEEQLEAFVGNVGQDVIGRLFNEVLQYNQPPVTAEVLDDAKKN